MNKEFHGKRLVLFYLKEPHNTNVITGKTNAIYIKGQQLQVDGSLTGTRAHYEPLFCEVFMCVSLNRRNLTIEKYERL
jgi:hypothetical protein